MEHMENIKLEIKINKENLETMPKNNAKNIKKYNEKLTELEEHYQKLQDEIYKKMLTKYKNLLPECNMSTIESLEKQISHLEEILFLFNDTQTSYEKMQLDYRVYNLGRYYRGGLEDVNKEIVLSIEAFNAVGVELTFEEFDYNNYVKEYMKELFFQMKNEEFNSEKMEEVLEKIYWKCPNIMIQIKLNIISLYFKNKKEIDKFYEKREKDVLRELNSTPKELKKIYNKLRKTLEIEKLMNASILIKKFSNGELNSKDYNDDKINKYCTKYFSEDFWKNKNFEEVNEEIQKLINSLTEYKFYEKYEYFLEDLRTIYKKELPKNSYNNAYKKYVKLEKKFRKNLKIINNANKFFYRKKVEKSKAILDNITDDFQEIYKELEKSKFEENVKKLNLTSTIEQSLYLSKSYMNYMINVIRNNPEIEQDDIQEEMNSLVEYVNSPNNTIISNVSFAEKKDIRLMIIDKYKLLGFSIDKEDLDDNNIDEIILDLKKVQIWNILKKLEIDVDDITSMCEFEKIKVAK